MNKTLTAVVLLCTALSVYAAPAQKAGLATYLTVSKSGDPTPPDPTYRTGKMLDRAATTNQWYSSVIFTRWSDVLHAHPVTYKADEAGFELGLAQKEVVRTKNREPEITYPHSKHLVVSATDFQADDARLSDASDWAVSIQMAKAEKALNVTILHGSPFSYYTLSHGNARIRLVSKPELIASGDARVIAFKVNQVPYAVFAPTGSKWVWNTPTELILELPRPADYFSIAALPDSRAETLANFATSAYVFVNNTFVTWTYDETNSKVISTYHFQTSVKEGTEALPLIGLYPHQWYGSQFDSETPYNYQSVRGKIKLLHANQFTLEKPYHGFVPFWGGLKKQEHLNQLKSVLSGDKARASGLIGKMGRGPYWIGKGLAATAQLMNVAEQNGDQNLAAHTENLIKQRLQSWFSGSHATYFAYNNKIGSTLAYPEEYGSVTAMNDHHFHYGYWIWVAAQLAIKDPQWAAEQNWRPMIDLIVADIATAERGRKDFPFVRNFDAYEGHSWAGGNGIYFGQGNNQEASSEAINAWAALVLWGEVTGNKPLRDLGIYLYTSEIEAANFYWFDVHRQVLDPEFGHTMASMVFGGKYAYNTWWTEEPRQIQGINLLPITTASVYLGQYPDYVKSYVSSIEPAKKTYESRGMSDGTPSDVWQDIYASYLGLADPALGLSKWLAHGSVELGETRSHTMFWLYSLNEMGAPDFTVTANTPLYAVFKDQNGKRTYLAYNASDKDIRVLFSNGIRFTLPSHKFASLTK